MTDDRQFFLSTLPAGRRERQLALAFVLVFVGIFLAAAPFATMQLAPMPAFIPIIETALVISDSITAVLLFGQFNILRSRALLVLASGYLFTAFITVAHVLIFPGVFSPTGLLGAEPQSAAWLYIVWHGGFPLLVIAYALLKDERREPIGSSGFARSRAGVAIFSSVAAVLVVVCGLTLLATAGHDFFPAVIQRIVLALQGDRSAQTFILLISADWILSFLALIVLWRRRPHTVLDLWLMVVMCAWLFDIALSGVLNAGRFDVGWYAGRIFGLLAGSLVLIMLLIEKGRLYAQLVAAHASERQERQLVQEKTVELVAVNKELDASIAELRDSFMRIQTILDTVVDGIITIDERGIVETLNSAAERMFGYAAAEVIGCNVKILMPEPYHSEHDGYLEHYRATGEARVIGIVREVVGRRKDGRTFPMEIEVSAMRLAGGRHFAGVVRDITQRRQAEEALLKAGALQSAIFNSANFSSIATDAKGVIQIFNVGAERMLGYAAAEVMNQITPADISDPQEVIARAKALSVELDTPITPGFEALVFKASRGIEDIYELTYIRKDGSRFPAVVSVTALHDAQNVIIGYLLIGTDNTARKQIEDRLRWTEESFRLMVESVTDYAIVMLDPLGRVVSWNSGAQRIKGYRAAEIVGQHFSRFYPREAIERGAPQRDLEVATTKGRFEDEGWRVRKDGSTFWANVIFTAIRDQVGNLRGFAKLTRDLTERRKVEAELTSAKLAAENANIAKSDFLANMSHELRTPLNSIIGFSEMLKDGVLGELETKQRGFITDIFGAGTHLLSLINDILDLSKVEAGMLQLEAGVIDLPALLKASTLIVREKALAHRIRLDTQLDPELGAMLADERKLKKIVYNLLSNAVKFTPEGGAVTLRARRCARTEVALDEVLPGRLIALPPGEDGEFLAISVEDTGVGIAAEHLPKLFEPFVQVDPSVSRRYGGTGLGLSLVRRLAELHGGTVGVASRPGAGSRFSAWLPYRAAAAAQEGGTAREGVARVAPGDTTPSAPAGALAPAPAVPLALVIEDDDRMADLITAQLRAEGFAVMRAATGEEGLVRAAKHQPQLITLDIFLPAMDGWEFMRRLKAEPKLADTPVVIITVSEDMKRGLALGARRVLQKPFARGELVAAFAGLVDARPAGEGVRVLVVDDNVKAVELVATALEAEGYRVLRAYGGAEAIEVAHSARPDFVILDLMMPEVSGFEVAHALRASEQTARIPILVLTAMDLSAEDRARLKRDVSAILSKASFGHSELLAELRRALPKCARD